MSDSQSTRQEHGFERTVCACAFCQAACRVLPGSLTTTDLMRLCPAGEDVFTWAEQHLRAVTDKSFPTLVPARAQNGHCHWLVAGRCAVHENAPYSCAFFDAHMAADEVARRSAATIQARREDAAAQGLYYRVWLHLRQKGLTTPSGDPSALLAELGKVQRRMERGRRRTGF